MKSISIRISDETARQMADLAAQWGLPLIRHNTPVLARCVERVWLAQRQPMAVAQLDAAALVTLARLEQCLPTLTRGEVLAAALHQLAAGLAGATG